MLITLEHIHTSQENFKRHFTHLLARDKTIAKSKSLLFEQKNQKNIEYIHRSKLKNIQSQLSKRSLRQMLCGSHIKI